MFLKIGALKNLLIFTEKQLCCSLFLLNLQAWRPVTSSKRDSKGDASLGNFQIYKPTFFTENLW